MKRMLVLFSLFSTTANCLFGAGMLEQLERREALSHMRKTVSHYAFVLPPGSLAEAEVVDAEFAVANGCGNAVSIRENYDTFVLFINLYFQKISDFAQAVSSASRDSVKSFSYARGDASSANARIAAFVELEATTTPAIDLLLKEFKEYGSPAGPVPRETRKLRREALWLAEDLSEYRRNWQKARQELNRVCAVYQELCNLADELYKVEREENELLQEKRFLLSRRRRESRRDLRARIGVHRVTLANEVSVLTHTRLHGKPPTLPKAQDDVPSFVTDWRKWLCKIAKDPVKAERIHSRPVRPLPAPKV